ncbi:MAG: YidC/Oxa1 family membrane protein insertase [Bacilli bacterium]|nr:YidC/Oxa1 family membrane protein insertase [Bacilli bacterium]
MKKQNKFKILIVIMLLLLTTGCTKTLTDKDNQAVKNEKTQQTLTENIICQPTDKISIKAYEENGVDIKKLPKCDNFKITSGKYEGLWTSFLVKPLAFILLTIGKILGFKGKYALSIIIVSLAIRLIAYPVTRKTALQSELIKKAQPELNRIQKKYQGKEDQESMMKQNQEILMVYKKYNINPMSGCLFSMLQLPLFIAFFEAVQRTPALFEDKFLGLQLGTTPVAGITTGTFYAYIILMLIIALTTFYSFKMNSTGNMQDPSMKMMPIMMSGMIIITALFMPSGLGIYWATTNLFTIVQNMLVKRSKEANGKA